MRFIVVADIHYALKQFDWLVKIAPSYDAIIIAGDLLELAAMVDRRAQIVVVRTYLAKLAEQTRVIVCSGNHDLDDKSEEGEQIAAWMAGLDSLGVASDFSSTTHANIRFSAVPWWDGPATKQMVHERLKADKALAHDLWVWVYHAPPADNPVSWSGRRHFGDPELNGWIDELQPDFVFSGHVHQSPFVPEGSWIDRIGKTWVFNTGQQPGPLPSHIAVNLGNGEAIWFSMMGAQMQSLSSALAQPAPLTERPDWVTI